MADAPEHTSRLLLAAAADGDEGAAAVIVERFRRRLLALVRRRLSESDRPRFDEEDVVQSAFRSFFVRATQGSFECEHPGDLWRLLAAISLNKLRGSVAEQTAAKRDVRRDGGGHLSGFVPVDFAVDGTGSPSEYAVAIDELNTIARTDEERRVLELRLAGHTEAEVAAQLGKTDRTVRRIRDRLRERAEQRLANLERDAPRPIGPRVERNPPAVPLEVLDETDLLLHEMVGAGGVGRVYRATWRSRDELVAVKFLRKAAARSEFVVDRFGEEAAHLASLDHPGILRIRGLGRSRSGLPFFVTAWCPGGDLSTRLGTCSAGDALRWVREVAEAVGFAHENGIVHCDLKPGNVLLDETGRAIVGDFGHALRPAVNARSLGGTRAYMAPEVLASSTAEVDERTDVYGLGALLVGLLANELPEEWLRTGDRQGAWATTAERSLAHDRADRFQSVVEFATSLAQDGDDTP